MIVPEAAAYLERIEDLRGQIAAIVQTLPPEALNWRPVAGEDDHVTNSIAVLTMHTAGAEHFWLGEVVGGLPATRNRAAEFEMMVEDTAVLSQTLQKVGSQTRTILQAITQADLDGTRQARNREVPVRWAILHVIDHTALHLGHIQITTQLWQGGQAIDAPRWFQRLKS
ncbi:DinB family protein [Candidatus Leptofilum sp.]|uniref:DinB family protein n=1 Tax=Candidatus Leptofilum sp. TaxID=3241576 RepID=UPI003B5BAC10